MTTIALADGVKVEVTDTINTVRNHLNEARVSAQPYHKASFTGPNGERVIVNPDQVLCATGEKAKKGGSDTADTPDEEPVTA